MNKNTVNEMACIFNYTFSEAVLWVFLLLDDFVDVGRFLFKDTRHCDLIAFFNFLIILKGGVVRFEETDSNLYEWCSIN